MIKLYARFKFESTRSRFQPGGGPSRGLLRNYEPFCGPPFEALIFPPRLDNGCNLLRPLCPARTLPTGQRTEAGPRIRIIINIDTLPRHYTLDTAHTGEWRSITWAYLRPQTNNQRFFKNPIGVDIHLYIYTSTLTLTAARGDGELFYKVEMDPSVGCVGSADGLTRQKLATRCRVWHSNINN